jgi:hypothetical protein
MKKTYHGSCHCGAVRFEAEIDLSGVTSRCNCSICGKSRFWKAIAKAGELRLVQGKEMLTDYSFGRGNIHHFFCKRCGVKAFGRGNSPQLGGEFHGVNLACLDDASDKDLGEAKVQYEDGRSDHWERAPAETRHL